MGTFIDLTGQRFGRLIVLHRVGNDKYHHATWQCLCDCGNTLVVIGKSLRSGNTRSCGCLMRDTSARIAKETATHNESHSRLYAVWCSMKRRCYNPNHKYYKDYGGRGIRICEEWRTDYQAFHDWAFSNGYDESAPQWACTIDRIDVNGDYSPDNCRWVDMKTQRQNRRDSRKDG